MRKLLLCVISLLTIGFIAAADKIPSPKGETFSSPGFSCKINAGGTIGNIKYKDKLLFKNTFLFGHYLIDKKGTPNRFFQGYRKKDPNMTVEKSNGKVVITTKGELSNKTFSPGAEFSEKVTLSPNEISFEYEVKTKVELKSRLGVFRTTLLSPCPIFNARGAKSIKPNGDQQLSVFPATYQKGTKTKIGGKSVTVVFDTFKLEFSGNSKDESIGLVDARSWGEDNYLFTITPFKDWRSKPWVYPAKTSFKWAFTLTAIPR